MTELRNLKRAVRRLIKAELEEQWSGAGYPGDAAIVIAELKSAKAAYKLACDRLEYDFGVAKCADVPGSKARP